jgi:hypothetical protein
MAAGLAGEALNRRYLDHVRDRAAGAAAWTRSASAARHNAQPDMEDLWNLHGGIVYLGIRRHIYHLPTPDDVMPVIERAIDRFLAGVRHRRDAMRGADPMTTLFAIHALDKSTARCRCGSRTTTPTRPSSPTPRRTAFSIVMSGPLMSDDGERDDRQPVPRRGRRTAPTVEAFNRADPFHAAGIWRAVTITRFLRRQG